MSAEDTSSLTGLLRSIGGGAGTYADKRLPALAPVPAILPRVGTAAQVQQATPSSGGGIASPVTEDSANGRLYWADRPLASSDGLIIGKWAPIKTLNMHDANGAAVVFSFRDQS